MSQLPASLKYQLDRLADMKTDDLDQLKAMLERRAATIITDVEAQLEKVFALNEATVEIDVELSRRRRT
jgi:hypothetical protein